MTETTILFAACVLAFFGGALFVAGCEELIEYRRQRRVRDWLDAERKR